MKALLTILLLSTVTSILAQEHKVGTLVSNDGQPVVGAHIQNLTQKQYTVSSITGQFKLPVSLGDSLWLSCVGYQSAGFVVQDQWASSPNMIITMQSDTIFLDAVTVNILPSEQFLKQQILNHQPEEKQSFYGMPQVQIGPSKMLSDAHVKSVGFAIRHPFGFAYHNLSKKQKEKRKAHHLKQTARNRTIAYDKFTRDYVQQLTKLEGNDLTNFMLYCDFSEEFLMASTQFQVGEAIKDKFKAYSHTGKG
ncbi:MAG: hypothetical protein JXQ90_20630 [Cyclobacteriaceae bacterium]